MDDDNKDSSSTNDNESAECHFERGTHSVNITGQGFEPRKTLLDAHTLNGIASLNNGRNSPIPSAQQSFSSFRDHIKSKASLAETFMKNISRNNNNTITTNFNHVPTNSNSLAEGLNKDSYNILQTSSKKLMDSARKHHKYLAKRKILMHYNDELNEKRLKEYERYNQEQQQHDANNNPELSNMPESSPVPVPQSHNSFKIRLMENHLKANQEQQKQHEHEQEQNNGNKDSSSNHLQQQQSAEIDDEEEALNLVQNNSHDLYHKSSESTNRISESSDSVMEAEHLDVDQSSESDVASTTNVEVGSQMRDEDDINNNNTTKQEIVELDDNNNSNLKNIALLNAMNRNVEHSKKLDYQRHTGGLSQAENATEQSPPQTQTPTHAESPQHQHHHHHHHESEEDNNNNHLQLDLSAVKSIATAEILCGLKSKVFKMEALDANENSPSALERQQTSRALSEIKNAD